MTATPTRIFAAAAVLGLLVAVLVIALSSDEACGAPPAPRPAPAPKAQTPPRAPAPVQPAKPRRHDVDLDELAPAVVGGTASANQCEAAR